MLELGRKETHLFSGIWIQILIVGLLVFAYTQAIRQLKHGQELYYRYQEQLTVAREQMSRQLPVLDLSTLQAEVDQLKGRFASDSNLTQERKWLESLAIQSFQFQAVQLHQTELPVDLLSFPIEGRPDFEVQLYGLELTATVTTRNAAALLALLAESKLQPMLSLATLEMRAAEGKIDPPVQFSARWWVPVVEGFSKPEGISKPFEKPTPLKWGAREEPFSSPMDFPSALRSEKADSFRLTGILWDPTAPSCVINKQVLKQGDRIESYQVVLIHPRAVILQGLDEEIVLHLS